MSAEKIYLNVPFPEKDVVKRLGARFDKDSAKWYITKNYNQKYFRHWIQPNEPFPSTDVLLEGIRRNIAVKCDNYSITAPDYNPELSNCAGSIAKRVWLLMRCLETEDGIAYVKERLSVTNSLGMMSNNELAYVNNLIDDYIEFKKEIESCSQSKTCQTHLMAS